MTCSIKQTRDLPNASKIVLDVRMQFHFPTTIIVFSVYMLVTHSYIRKGLIESLRWRLYAKWNDDLDKVNKWRNVLKSMYFSRTVFDIAT